MFLIIIITCRLVQFLLGIVDREVCEGGFEPIQYNWLYGEGSRKTMSFCGHNETLLHTHHQILINAVPGCYWLMSIFTKEWFDRSIKIQPMILDGKNKKIICFENWVSILYICRKGDAIKLRRMSGALELPDDIHLREFGLIYKGKPHDFVTPMVDIQNITSDTMVMTIMDISRTVKRTPSIKFYPSFMNTQMCPAVMFKKEYCTKNGHSIAETRGPHFYLKINERWDRLEYHEEEETFVDVITYHVRAPFSMRNIYEEDGVNGVLRLLA